VAAVASAVLPDLDVIGYRLGVPYESMLGHRGLTHSIPFAAVWALGLAILLLRAGTPGVSGVRLWTVLFLATASHGVLDALTDGGGGVAFFAPFTADRFFLPWHPLPVSPLSIRRFFSLRGLLILRSEVLWVWLPAAATAGAVLLVRRRRRSAANDA
jgi:inner membrane protein